MSGTTTDPQPTWVEKIERLGAAGMSIAIYLLLAAAMFLCAKIDMAANQTFTNIVETVKSLALLAAGFWLGNSKSGQDTSSALSNIAKQSAGTPPAELITALKDNTAATVQSAAATTANTSTQGTKP